MTDFKTRLRAAVAAVLPIRRPNPGPDEWVRRTVLVVWLASIVVPVQFVVRYGANNPFLDEWCMVKPLVGEYPLWPWVWERHNEHLYPLPRLAWWGLFQLTGGDFRGGMFVSVWAMASSSWLVLRGVWHLRGKARLGDLFIPALFLHEGYLEVWIVGYNLSFALAALFATAAFALIARGVYTPLRLLAVGGTLFGLLACGGGAVLLVPALAAWLAWAAVRESRTTRRWLPAGFVVAAAIAALGLSGGYVLTTPKVDPPDRAFEPLAAARTALEFVGGTFGAVGQGNATNPFDLARWVAVVGVVVVLVGGGIVFAVRAAVLRPDERTRAAGVAVFLLMGVAMAAVIGWKRWWVGPGGGFSPRYAVFSVVFAAGGWAAWAGYFGELARRSRRTFELAVAAIAASALVHVWAIATTERTAEDIRHHQERLWYGSQNGTTPEKMAAAEVRHVLTPEDKEETRAWLADGLRVLERHRVGCYRWLRQADPP